MLKKRTREEMLIDIVKMFGFEDERTIDFAHKCEKWEENDFNDNRLENIVAKHQVIMKRYALYLENKNN